VLTGSPDRLGVLRRNNVTVSGPTNGRPMLFAHGFGCSQEMWRLVAPEFANSERVILFDHVGAGGSDVAAYERGRYDSLHGYASDLLELVEEMDLHDIVFIGHSVSAMIGVLAANRAPERFGALVLIAPSPRYIDDEGYSGGFEQADIDALLDSLDADYLGWSSSMAPVIMGNAERPELSAELTRSLCATDPAIARHFARVTFLSDNRRDLDDVTVSTLILQSADDVIAPASVGSFVLKRIRGSRLVILPVNGHCPHLSAPAEVSTAIRAFLG